MNLEKVIPAYWHRSINFGDQLTKYIIEKLSGYKVIYCDHINDCSRLMATGSILSEGNLDKSIIWGNGFAWYADPVYKPLQILAVRGKLTRKKFIDSGINCPEVYGDPALLLPSIHNPLINKKYKLGIIPHLIDYEKVKWEYEGNNIVIDLREPIETVINNILQCEKIISSSLHGIIVSQAYGIPTAWVKFSSKIIGDDFKFHDHFSICEQQGAYKMKDVNQAIDIPAAPQFNTSELLKC